MVLQSDSLEDPTRTPNVVPYPALNFRTLKEVLLDPPSLGRHVTSGVAARDRARTHLQAASRLPLDAFPVQGPLSGYGFHVSRRDEIEADVPKSGPPRTRIAFAGSSSACQDFLGSLPEVCL